MFHSFLLEDAEFRNLNIPMSPNDRKDLEIKIRQFQQIPPIHSWNKYALDNYDEMDLCLKYHRPFQSFDTSFTSRQHAISWICREQLKREDLVKCARIWLLYKLYKSETTIERSIRSKEDFQYKKLSPSTRDVKPIIRSERYSQVLIRIAKEYKVYPDTLAKYAAFGKKIDILDSLFPGIRTRVLTGKVEIQINHINDLLEMPQDQLQAMIEDPKCRKLIPPQTSARKPKPAERKPRQPKFKLQTAIKQMPTFDPDSALNGLFYTISVWKKTITQAQENKGLLIATAEGKKRLSTALHELKTEINTLETKLEDHR